MELAEMERNIASIVNQAGQASCVISRLTLVILTKTRERKRYQSKREWLMDQD